MDIQPQTPVPQPLEPAPSEGGPTPPDFRLLAPWAALALAVGIFASVTTDAWSNARQEADAYHASTPMITSRAKLASLQAAAGESRILDPLAQYGFGHRFVCRQLFARFRTDEMGSVFEIVRRHNASLAAPALPGPRGWLVSVGGACTHEATQRAISDFAADPDVVSVEPHYVGI